MRKISNVFLMQVILFFDELYISFIKVLWIIKKCIFFFQLKNNQRSGTFIICLIPEYNIFLHPFIARDYNFMIKIGFP